jgi:Beta-1,3-glucanase
VWETVEEVMGQRSVIFCALALVTAFIDPTLSSHAQAQRNNQGQVTIPLVIVNNYDPQKNLWVYINGTSGTPPNLKKFYVTDKAGNVSLTPELKTAEDVKNVSLEIKPNDTLRLPQLDGLRVYISVGKSLQVHGPNVAGQAPAEPAGWIAKNSPDKINYETVFDFVELTWVNVNRNVATTNLGANTTQVDMFGLPLYLELTGYDPSHTDKKSEVKVGMKSTLDEVMKAYEKLGEPWKSLVIKTSNVKFRVISPYKAMDPNSGASFFSDKDPNNFQEYIRSVWQRYLREQIRLTYRHGACTNGSLELLGATENLPGGKPGEERLVFVASNSPRPHDTIFWIKLPTASTVYRNELFTHDTEVLKSAQPPLSECYLNAARDTARDLSAQLIRTTLLADSRLLQGNCPSDFTKKFYISAPVQEYAKFWHDFSEGGLAYSFGFDDSCNRSSFATVDRPQSVKITVGGVR